MSKNVERREFTVDRISVRAEAGAEGERAATYLEGHAAVFNTPAAIAGLFREQVAPGAFAEAIARPDDVRALFNHNPDQLPLARTKSGTLELREDDTGLAVRIELPDTQLGRDLVVSIERGDVSQMSFGFRAEVEEWSDDAGEKLPLRTLKQVRLYDVSPVTFPAYDATDISVAQRSLDEYRAEHPAPTPKLDLARRKLRLAEASG